MQKEHERRLLTKPTFLDLKLTHCPFQGISHAGSYIDQPIEPGSTSGGPGFGRDMFPRGSSSGRERP